MPAWPDAASPETGPTRIYVKILSFANFGFAESHALSFALLVYARRGSSCTTRRVFLAGLLRNQPMGFYSPQSLVADARRHGVEVLRPDYPALGCSSRSRAVGTPADGAGLVPGRRPHRVGAGHPDPTRAPADAARRTARARLGPGHRHRGRRADRGGAGGERPFADMADLSRRAGLSSAQLEALATAGAFDGFGLDRRQALWMPATPRPTSSFPAAHRRRRRRRCPG